MASSVLVLETDNDLKFDRSCYGKFFSNFAVPRTVFLGKESFAKAAAAPLCDLLLIAFQSVNSQERAEAMNTLEAIYKTNRLPIIHAGSKEVASISEEFLSMTFGDSLSLLKDKKVSNRQKALYVVARFFADGAFQRSAYVAKLKQLSKDFPEAQIGGLVQDFVGKGFIKSKDRGIYQFVGLDQRSYIKLESAGFDMDQAMCAAGVKKNDKAPKLEAAVPLTPTPAIEASKVVPTPKATSDLDTLVRQEFAQLREDLAQQVQEQVQKALASQKINDKLLGLSPKQLQKASAMLDLLASP